MKEDERTQSIAWFINPWWDIILFCGIPFGILPIYLLGYFQKCCPTIFNGFSNPLFLIGYAHLLATPFVVYADKDEFGYKRKPAQFLWVCLAFLLLLSLYSKILDQATTTIIFLWVLWHILAQCRNILRLHNFINSENHITNDIALLAGPVYFVCRYLNKHNLTYLNAPLYPLTIPPLCLTLLYGIFVALISIFVIRQTFLFVVTKKVNVFFNVAMVGAVNFIFYLLAVSDQAIITLAFIFKWYHSSQYLAWLPFYHRMKVKSSTLRGTTVLSWLSQPGRAVYYIGFLLLVAWIYKQLQAGMSVFFLQNRIRYDLLAWTIVLFHLFFDSFLWNVRKVTKVIPQVSTSGVLSAHREPSMHIESAA